MDKGKYHKAIIGLKSGAIGGAIGGAINGMGYAVLFFILPGSLLILIDITEYSTNWTFSLVLVGVVVGIVVGTYIAKASNNRSWVAPVLGGIASMLFVWIIFSPSLRDENLRGRVLTTMSAIGIILSGMVIGAPVGGIAGAILGTIMGLTSISDRLILYPTAGGVAGALLMSPFVYAATTPWSGYFSVLGVTVTFLIGILCGVLGGVIARRMYKRLSKREATEVTQA